MVAILKQKLLISCFNKKTTNNKLKPKPTKMIHFNLSPFRETILPLNVSWLNIHFYKFIGFRKCIKLINLQQQVR